jgi:uncharacterized protein
VSKSFHSLTVSKKTVSGYFGKIPFLFGICKLLLGNLVDICKNHHPLQQKNCMNYSLVLGASPNPTRISHMAVKSLLRRKIPVYAVGKRKGTIDVVDIQTGKPKLKDVHTVMLYVSPKNQVELYDYILNQNPRRIIFNPGTENQEFIAMAKSEGIEVVLACGLVMLNTGVY